MKEKEVLLTIKVAACGVECYLNQCLKTFADEKYIGVIQVIVVVNQCKDRTLEIAQEYEKRYPEIFNVISQGNENYASTYNVGFRLAKGKYFTNLDGDDWFEKDEFDKYLVLLKEQESDIIASNMVMVADKDKKEKKYIFSKYDVQKEYEFEEVCTKERFVYMHELTVRTRILHDNQFSVNHSSIIPDVDYELMIIPYINTITYSGIELYHYRQGRPGQETSISKMVEKEKKLENTIDFMIEWEKKLVNVPDEKRECIRQRIADVVNVKIYSSLLQPISKKQMKKIKSYIRKIELDEKKILDKTSIFVKLLARGGWVFYPFLSVTYKLYKRHKKFVF